MHRRSEEEKRSKDDGNRHLSNKRKRANSANSLSAPNEAVHSHAASPPTEKLKHEDNIWPFYLCTDDNFAKTFMCSECQQIPKTGHAFTSESGYIYCEYCIDELIETQRGCKTDNKRVQQKNPAKVIDNLVRQLRIKCPHCKQSQLQQRSPSKGSELKMDEIDDMEADDAEIQMPPFPTSHVGMKDNHMNEGMDDNNVNIVGIGGGNMDKKKDSVYFCDWTGTINDLDYHLQNDCKFIKINCPLNELDASLCDAQNMYQHQMKHHLEQCSVTHWQQIVKQINELKSIQLASMLKQTFVSNHENQNDDDGEMERASSNRSNQSSSSLLNTNSVTTQTPNPFQDLLQSHSNEIAKLRSEMEQCQQKLQQEIQVLTSELSMKDIQIRDQNNKLCMMQKQISNLHKTIAHQSKSNQTEDPRRKYHVDYESEITSMFNQSNHGHQQMMEMQQMLLQTQSKIDSISTEIKQKDGLIESQKKSISALQSQVSAMNISATQSAAHVTPGAPGYTSHHAAHSHSSHVHNSPPHRPIHPAQHSMITPGGSNTDIGGITPRYSTHLEQAQSFSHPSRTHIPGQPHLPSPPTPDGTVFDAELSGTYVASSDPSMLSRKRHHQSPMMTQSKSVAGYQQYHSHHTPEHHRYHGTRKKSSLHPHHVSITPGGIAEDEYEHHFNYPHARRHQHPQYGQPRSQPPLHATHSQHAGHSLHPLNRDGIGSKSLNSIHFHHETDKIYRSDSGGSADKMNDDNHERDRPQVPSLVYPHSHHQGHSQEQLPPRLALSSSGRKSVDTDELQNVQARVSHNDEKQDRKRHKKHAVPVLANVASLGANHHKPGLILYGVGYNEEGEIGIGHRRNLSSYTRLPFCNTMDIIGVYYGSQSFFYLTRENELYCCGYNKYGQLGLGHTTEYIIKPTLNKYLSNDKKAIDFISNSVCSYHTILKTKSGRLYGIGWNKEGQLGIGKKSFKESVPIELTADVFNINGQFGDYNIISIACGFHHTLFLCDDGRVICCGSNAYGQLGFGSNVTEVTSPSFVDSATLKDIISVQCGEYYSTCLDKNGQVWVFGRNDSGQLGLGKLIKNEDCVYTPRVVEYFKQNGIVITKIQCGDYHTLALDSTGNCYVWGNNEYGQVGCMEKKLDSFTNTPTRCKLPNNNKSTVIIDINAGAYHSLLLSEDNEVYAFGNNDCNQCSSLMNLRKLNSPYWVKKNTEVKCLEDDGDQDITQIIAGYDCSFVVTYK